MSGFPKVIWSEGMLLSPHHFQRFERNLLYEQNFRLSAFNPFNWGISLLEIDQSELTNGSFSLLKCQGIMPDGLIIDISGPAQRPETRLIGEKFTISMNKCDVYLAVTKEHDDVPTCNLPETPTDREVRYRVKDVDFNDLNTGDNKRAVRVARANYKILFTGDALDNYSYIKIAELEREQAGFSLHNEYIPPCLYISASTRIQTLLQDLLSKLSVHSLQSAHIVTKMKTMPQLQTDDIYHFLMRITINNYLPVIHHYYQQRKVHPETVFQVLIELAGALTAFNTDIKPNDLVGYRHENLMESFNVLCDVIQKLIKVKTGKNYEEISLRKEGDKLMGSISNEQLEKAQFFLAITSNMPPAQVQTLIPQVVKIAAPSKIDTIVARALPGLKMGYVSRPPMGVPEPGEEFFQLQQTDPLWEDIKIQKQITIFYPQQFQISGIKLIAFRKAEN